MTESQFQRQVIDFLRKQDIWFVKYWGGGRFTRAGIPDIICCVNGYFVAIELKTKVGQVTKLQEFNIDRIHESGGVAIVLRPDKFEQFKSWIEEVKRCPTPNIPIPESARINNARHNTNTATSTV